MIQFGEQAWTALVAKDLSLRALNAERVGTKGMLGVEPLRETRASSSGSAYLERSRTRSRRRWCVFVDRIERV